ncbi:putative Trans-cinnamate 4-monooxygenase [Cocos nucifera]|uniref:trans-cinnamate 4-monooxygenase n=1 Tax=Cocos nucifera TaxID=13894 RepID=A0A8K0IYI5_COCNU|nr:putative Trans-cinnamate 4-monooxygenase [Cocos nucifera]
MDLVLLEKALLGLFAAVTVAIAVSKFRGKRFKLPPGPLPVPIFGNWLQVGDDLNHRNLTALAKRFGDILLLRMGQRNLVVVSSPELAREVLHTQGVEFGSRTRNVVFDIFTGKGQDMVFTVYGEHWRKMRRIMTVPFFTNKVVQHNRHGWEEEARRVVEDVKANPKAATEGIVLRRRLQLMMYNNMFRIMFDRRFESEDDPLFNKLKALNGERSRLAQSFDYNYGDFIPILRPFLKGYLKICQEVKDRRLQLFKDYFIEERKNLASIKGATNVELKCAIDHILEAERKGEINEDNVLYIVENINVAAIETTLWSIEWGIAELVNHPEIQRKLRHELDTVLGPGVQITEPDTHKLPYLQAVIKETLRLRMAIPLLVPHMNLHDAQLGGYDIPAESKILVNAWWLANNPDNWKNPEGFRPERFLEEEAKVEANGNDFRYLPFGVGRRSCPGIILALPILGITIGRLVQNFELLPPPEQSKIDTTEKGGQFTIETTLWSIEWGIAELVNHPEIQRKLRHELDTVLGPGVQITEPDTHKLPYLQAVIKETLRLRMAIPLLVPHMNLHDAQLGGYDIPAESKILVNAWWLANNPDNWKNPEGFRPERFLEEEAKVEANGNDFRYLPFGVGRRSCPGIILALPILGITIGRLVQNFELLPPPEQSKIDTTEKGGQFSLHILKHSTIVCKPRVL